MATSTLIQYLDKTQNTASGGTVAVGASSSNRSETETFLTEGVIVKGQWVQLDLAQTGASKVLVVQAGAVLAGGNASIVGVALESVTGTAASPQPVRVCISGFAEALVSPAALAARSPLVVGVALGTAEIITAAALAPACGCSLVAALAPPLLTEVFVYKQF